MHDWMMASEAARAAVERKERMMKIGIIGSGAIGGTAGKLWARAGHEVMFASRHPERLAGLVDRVGNGARAGTVPEVAGFGEAVLLAINWWTVDEAVEAAGPLLAGKTVIDTTNPYGWASSGGLERMVPEGTSGGETLQARLPEARVVKAFNTMPNVAGRAHRRPEVAMFYAGDDPGALKTAAGLIADAGFAPVPAGPLSAARRTEIGGDLQMVVVGPEEAARLAGALR